MPDPGGVSSRKTVVNFRIVLSAKAIKFLDRLDRKTEQRIQSRIDELAVNPINPRISNKMETAELKRYSRVGDWRIVYEIEENNQRVFIITIQHRSRVYKEFKK
jgi:mRNA interferase RelE/StbE